MNEEYEERYIRPFARRKWKFEIIIPEGQHEFFEELTDETEIPEITRLIEEGLAFYGFHTKYGLEIKGERVS